MELLIFLAAVGYATAAGAARQLHLAEFDGANPKYYGSSEERVRRGAVMILWPIVLPVMLGILLCRRWAAKVRNKIAEKDRMAAAGGIRLGPEIEIRDDDTYRRLTIAVQKYEKERGYDG